MGVGAWTRGSSLKSRNGNSRGGKSPGIAIEQKAVCSHGECRLPDFFPASPISAHSFTRSFLLATPPTHSEITPEGGVSMPPGGPPMMGAQAGPMMMFVNLLPEEAPDKTAWSSTDIDVLTKKWRAVRTVFFKGRREGLNTERWETRGASCANNQLLEGGGRDVQHFLYRRISP